MKTDTEEKFLQLIEKEQQAYALINQKYQNMLLKRMDEFKEEYVPLFQRLKLNFIGKLIDIKHYIFHKAKPLPKEFHDTFNTHIKEQIYIKNDFKIIVTSRKRYDFALDNDEEIMVYNIFYTLEYKNQTSEKLKAEVFFSDNSANNYFNELIQYIANSDINTILLDETNNVQNTIEQIQQDVTLLQKELVTL